MNNKGQIQNYFAVIALLFSFAIITMIAMVIMLGFQTAFTDAGIWTGQIAETGEDFISAIQMYDSIAVVLLAALLIGVGLTSFRLNTAPAFFIVTLILAGFLGFTSYIYNYVFIQFVSQPTISAVEIYFPKMIAIATNLHWIALAAIVIGSVTLYAKKPQEGGEFVE